MSKNPELNRKHFRDWYRREGNAEKKIVQRRVRMKTHKAFINAQKNIPCMDCSDTFPNICMDFDHRPDEEKLFNLAAAWTRSKDKIIAEIAKCDVVCSNCHRLRTEKRRKFITY